MSCEVRNPSQSNDLDDPIPLCIMANRTVPKLVGTSLETGHPCQYNSRDGALTQEEHIASAIPLLLPDGLPTREVMSSSASHSFRRYSPDDGSTQDQRTTFPAPLDPSHQPLYEQSSLLPLTQSELLYFLLRTTCPWVAAGVLIMLAGITIVQVALLPRIYTCPSGATCPNSFDPRTNVLSLVQTLMQYWLRFGTIIAGCGLVRLIAYQSWCVLKHKGNSIKILDVNIGAIKGSPYDAVLLFFERRNRWLGVFTICQFAIGAVISLVIGLSISGLKEMGEVMVNFQYAPNVTLLAIPPSITSNKEYAIFNMMNEWSLSRNWSHGLPDGFQGTLVLGDSRSLHAVNAQPGGPRIIGTVSCSGAGISVERIPSEPHPLPYPEYNISFNGPRPFTIMVIPGYGRLRTTFLGKPYGNGTSASADGPISLGQSMWVSNTPGTVPGGMTTSDGGMEVAVCTHVVSMHAASISDMPGIEGDEPQYINPSLPVSPDEGIPCDQSGKACLTALVIRLVDVWWAISNIGENMDDAPLSRVSCRNGMITPLDDNGEDCQLNNETWSLTATAMADAIMQTGRRTGNATQQLLVHTESISRMRWWLQGTIPLATLLLYIVCLVYTLHVSRGEMPKELDHFEVIAVALKTEEVFDLAQEGELKRSTRIGSMNRSPENR